MFSNRTIAIFGATGSWGRELTRQLLAKNPKQIIAYARGEISQVDMERTFNNPRVKYVIGDIRDRGAVEKVFETGIDYVFQLAALKHVPICENQPMEAIKTNILGVANVIDAAIKYKVKKFIDVSTDKAADPSNLYGCTKAIGEKLTIQANCQTKDTEFICIRAGNVLGTNGSIVPYIIDQIRTTNSVKVTNREMTRFLFTLPEAIELLFFAVSQGVGGETYVMNMPSFYLIDLVTVLVGFYGNSDTVIEVIGTRPGEKIHEVLISEHELLRTDYVNEDYYVIYPQIKTGREYLRKPGGKRLFHSFTSENNVKGKKYLTELLKKGGFLELPLR